MAALYHSLFTEKGLELLRESIQNGTKLGITQMSFGDGGGVLPTPDSTFTSMINEVYRVELNRLEPARENANWLEADGLIPSAVGGFNIREVGLWAGNVMVAYANYPSTYKPSSDQGTAQIKTIRIVLQIDNTANFELKIDASVVMATIQVVEDAKAEIIEFVNNKLKKVNSIENLKNIKNPKTGDLISIVSYHSGLNLGGGDFIFDQSKVNIDDGGHIINGWVRVDRSVFKPENFGAKYLKGVNDTDSFVLMSKAVQQNGGGAIVVPQVEVLWGKQQFANGSKTLGYSFKGQDLFFGSNLSKPVIIMLQGTVFRLEDGLKYGSYDYITGLPSSFNAISYYRASVGDLFNYSSCEALMIYGDGTAYLGGDTVQLGGSWGSDGNIQIAGSGVSSVWNKYTYVENLECQYACLDSFYISASTPNELSEGGRFVLQNCESEYAGRQGFSWVGGNQGTAINCKFNRTGRGQIVGNPSAGIDIEPNTTAYSRRGLFLNVEIIDNAGSGLIGDHTRGDDFQFVGGRIVGTTAAAINTALDVKLFGVHISGAIIGGDNLVFNDCDIDDNVSEFRDVDYSKTPFTRVFVSTQSPIIRGGTIKLKNLALGSFLNAKIKDLSVEFLDEKNHLSKDSIIPVAVFGTSELSNVKLYDKRSNPTKIFTTSGGKSIDLNNEIVTRTGMLRWGGSTGREGILPLSIENSDTSIKGLIGTSFIGVTRNATAGLKDSSHICRIMFASTEPANPDSMSPYRAGDVIKNSNPSSSSFLELTCITPGYPCTTQFVPNTSLAVNTYLYSGNNVYKVSIAGVTSDIAPTHTAGSVKNGESTLDFVGTKAVFRKSGATFSGLSTSSTSAEIVNALKSLGLVT